MEEYLETSVRESNFGDIVETDFDCDSCFYLATHENGKTYPFGHEVKLSHQTYFKHIKEYAQDNPIINVRIVEFDSDNLEKIWEKEDKAVATREDLLEREGSIKNVRKADRNVRFVLPKRFGHSTVSVPINKDLEWQDYHDELKPYPRGIYNYPLFDDINKEIVWSKI